MIQGITILETILCRESSLFTTIALSLFLMIICGFVVWFCWFLLKYHWQVKRNKSFQIFIYIIAAFAIIGSTINTMYQIEEYYTTHNEYIVKVDKEVSLVEFMSRYNVIETYDVDEYRISVKEVIE